MSFICKIIIIDESKQGEQHYCTELMLLFVCLFVCTGVCRGGLSCPPLWSCDITTMSCPHCCQKGTWLTSGMGFVPVFSAFPSPSLQIQTSPLSPYNKENSTAAPKWEIIICLLSYSQQQQQQSHPHPSCSVASSISSELGQFSSITV